MERLQSYQQFLVRFWKEKHITKIILLLFFIVILITMLFFAYLASTANVKTLMQGLSQATVIYDRNGAPATEVSTNRTKGINIEELPTHIQNAVIAIEDQRFYEHNGFDVQGIARAFFKNIFSGRITGGGSTITQQLTKNALLSPEKSYVRKLEELFLAVEIEKNYSKDDILQMYLNQVYFGSGAWGMSQASNKYFNKNLNDVTISEAALLAGLLQAPSASNPYHDYERAIKRRDTVLSKMNELEMISDTEYNLAINEQIDLNDGGGSFIERSFPYYVDAVFDEAIKEYGLTQEEILTRGYHIYTEMDQNLQTTLEKVYERDSLFPTGKNGILVQSGSVLLDPNNGGVRGLVGGRGEYVFRGFNRATHLRAQPGSTLKPLAVYTPALEMGYDVTSTLLDEQQTFGDYTPSNATKTFKGKVPMYEAIEESINLPAVWLLNKIGLNNGLDSLKRFDIPLEEEDRNLGIALGGMYKGISPLQLAESYAVFPNGGKRNKSHLITKIVGPTGNIIAEYKTQEIKVTSNKVANKMTSMLLNVVESGTGKRTYIPEVQIAGKTGSTQLPYDDINGTKDQWFVGYTATLVGATWVGYDKTDREHYLTSSSADTVVPIFKTIIEQSLQFTDPGKFEVLSVNDTLAGKKQPTIDKLENIKENAEKLEVILTDEGSKWRQVLEQIKKDVKTLEQKARDAAKELLNK